MDRLRVITYAAACFTAVLLPRCGDGREVSFKKLATDKEVVLKGLLNTAGPQSKMTCENFGYGTEGDRGGVLSFDVVTLIPEILIVIAGVLLSNNDGRQGLERGGLVVQGYVRVPAHGQVDVAVPGQALSQPRADAQPGDVAGPVAGLHEAAGTFARACDQLFPASVYPIRGPGGVDLSFFHAGVIRSVLPRSVSCPAGIAPKDIAKSRRGCGFRPFLMCQSGWKAGQHRFRIHSAFMRKIRISSVFFASIRLCLQGKRC
jgi:hypothetical protein